MLLALIHPPYLSSVMSPILQVLILGIKVLVLAAYEYRISGSLPPLCDLNLLSLRGTCTFSFTVQSGRHTLTIKRRITLMKDVQLYKPV